MKRFIPALRDCAGLIGAALTAYGAGAIYYPAGFIAGGLMLMGGALLAARS